MAQVPLITIRPEKPADGAVVRNVNEQAFNQPNEAALVDALRAAADPIVSVAVDNEQLVGHILFSPVTIEDDDSGSLTWRQAR